ncbi:hypothetical protein HCX50_17165 [Microbacterium oxydans]|uniref:hypothetical protein n=1 Tax=Microbacterium sp. B19(2022) TaxID=2914045 RepID=UPI00142FFCAC|nr:hypothetical protein [Microbacterium sp. B19(2022)]NJI61159.1 hypothetical protein [Microbacterium sp. B19(2022)]
MSRRTVLPPRPADKRRGMTKVGALRDEYNAVVEGRPTRWVRTLLGYEPNPAFTERVKRANAWAAEREAIA